jgi:hypothetical protein
MPCSCRYSWAQLNLATSSSIAREADTTPTQVSNFQVICPAPSIYNNDTEIPSLTAIKIRLVPAMNNPSNFTTNTVSFTKQPITATGDFRDAEGRAFRNVLHYVCFDKLQKSLGIDHSLKTVPLSAQNTTQIQLPVANSFQAGSASTSSSYSSQSYYYDFYIRSNETGTISSGSSSFTCPQVNINGTPSYFPMDSQFALALQTSNDYPISVVAASTLESLNSGGSSSGGSGTNVGGGSTGGTSSSSPPSGVLGYAAKPNADGTCPQSAPDLSGRVHLMFRLRKYLAIYPLRFDTDGSVLSGEAFQQFNTIYVLDRPVNKLTQNPLKPITRLGPKPCPFSFNTVQFGQKCMSDASLAGWNIDGTQIPGNSECPVYPPLPPSLVKTDGTLVIRPYKPFTMHYLEDTTFKACAFQSSNPVDPEMVVVHDDNAYPGISGPKDFYCAKHYPPVGAIIQPPGGSPFTRTPGDCDTVASAAAIKSDQTYACSRTYNPTNSALSTPAAGCCQICSGTDCRSVGGGNTPSGRNAAFSPPQNSGNPPQATKLLSRGQPNQSTSNGCFDPSED